VSTNLALILTAATLIGCGVYLVLERSLTRVLVGLLIMGNGVNILFLISGGRAGDPPIEGTTSPADMSDPLPQALVLTAIVIGFATTALFLVVLLTSRGLAGNDHVDGEDGTP
jgi:multicomponent Na+:H+ antiporter subunit C